MVPGSISIGKLAKATGFSVERLRMWELRYGQPQGQRLPSGHRRYSAEEVERLHLVAQVLARGRRPRHVVALPREQLLALLEAPAGTGRPEPPKAADLRARAWSPQAWVQAATAMNEDYLNRQFYEHWLDLGSLRFLSERAQPFIQALGDEWQKGELCVAEEHFGSEKMGDFLAGIWRRLNEHNEHGPVLLTTLPGDAHRLGLQMAAVVCAMAGLKVVYLGPSTPLEEVALVAERNRAKAVFLSAALGTDHGKAREQLLQLRGLLPPQAVLGIGGAGAPWPPKDEPGAWQRHGDLNAFYLWARAWKSGPKLQTALGGARP
jgi:MerR family transcriptional regulator, light-induced transcriptional regulator